MSSSRSQVPALVAPPHAARVALQTDLGVLKDGPPSSLTLASPSGRSRAGSVASGSRCCGEGPGARPAPGRRLALPARLRGLGPETGAAGTRAAGQSSLRPSIPRSPRSARGLPRGPDGCRPGLRSPLGTDLSRNPVASSAHPGLSGREHGRRCPLRGRGLHPASGSPRGYRVPQTSRIFVAARSEVVLGDLKVSVSNFGVGVTMFCPVTGIR